MFSNEYEVVEGMKLDRCYISPYFITNQKNQKCRRKRQKMMQLQQSGECHSHTTGEKKKNEDNKKNPDGVIVLGVYIHCEGCQDEVLRCLRVEEKGWCPEDLRQKMMQGSALQRRLIYKVMLDTVGPELQVVNKSEKAITLKVDNKVILTPNQGQEATPEVLPINSAGLPKVQISTFEVDIKELPEQIDTSTYSSDNGMSVRSK